MSKNKKKAPKAPVPDHDFTFQEVVTGTIKFNDKNVLHIVFDTAANKADILKLDMKTGQSFAGSATLEEEV